MASNIDRRKHTRFNVNLSLDISDVDVKRTHEMLKNLEMGGLFITKTVYLPMNKDIQFEILLKDGEKKIRPAGIVKQNIPVGTNKMGIGIEFLKISEEDKQILVNFLDRTKNSLGD